MLGFKTFSHLMLFAAVPLLCQGQDRGAIIGRVTDPSNAVCRGHHHQSGYRHQDYQCHQRCGQLVVRGMAFGSYEIACEAKGFRKYLRRSNSLNVAQTLTIDITLEIGEVDQTVEVSGAAPLIESSTSDLGTVVDQKQVRDLPLSVSGNMRNPESFVLLAPGVTGDTANTEINGSQDRAKEVLADGAQSTGPESGGTVGTYPPVEAIGEFKLEAANFSAEYPTRGSTRPPSQSRPAISSGRRRGRIPRCAASR